jgi:hypothetical protein
VSHFGGIFLFNSTIHFGVSYSAWYASLPYQVVHPIGHSLWCITFGVMRHLILPCRLTRVYSTSWDSPVRGPTPIITFWFQRIRGVQKHPPPLRYRLIHCGPPKCALPPAQAHQALPGKPTTSSLTASRADRPAQGFSPNNLATTTTSAVVDYNLNFKLRTRPPALNLGLGRWS